MTRMLKPKQPTVRTRVPIVLGLTRNKKAEMVTFRNLSDPREHVACLFGPLGGTPLVRLHSECLTGDVFGSLQCDCGQQLKEALELLSLEGGVLLYLRQEGRGIGLYNKLETYDLQNRLQVNTFEANRLIGRGEDERDYRVAAEMLRALGFAEIRLITNNPDKVDQLQQNGIRVQSVQHTGTYVTPYNLEYLSAKAWHSGHRLDLDATQVSNEVDKRR